MSLSVFGITDYYSEIIFTPPIESDSTSLYQQYITYDKNKIKGFQKGFKPDDAQRFSIKGWATVPISGNEILDLSVYILKNREIEDFGVNYRTILDPSQLDSWKIQVPLIPGYTQQEVYSMLIRADYGHGKNLKHTNIDLYTRTGKKISESSLSFIEQKFEIPFYEMALHYVFMQAEKHNILVGPQYWISPFQTHLQRTNTVYGAWINSGVATPLCIVSRNIQTKMAIMSHNNNREILDSAFKDIVEGELTECKRFENENPNDFKVIMPYSEDYFLFPFYFYKPTEDAIFGAYEYQDGVQHELQLKQLGLVFGERAGTYYNWKVNT